MRKPFGSPGIPSGFPEEGAYEEVHEFPLFKVVEYQPVGDHVHFGNRSEILHRREDFITSLVCWQQVRGDVTAKMSRASAAAHERLQGDEGENHSRVTRTGNRTSLPITVGNSTSIFPRTVSNYNSATAYLALTMSKFSKNLFRTIIRVTTSMTARTSKELTAER